MARTNKAAVAAVLGADYGPQPDKTFLDLQPFIDAMSDLTTQVVRLASTHRGGLVITTTTAELIERWLAAWAYAMSDKPLASEGRGRASGSFVGQTGMGLESNNYGQTAMRIDWTRTLAALDKGNYAGTEWLGKPLSAWIPYSVRSGG